MINTVISVQDRFYKQITFVFIVAIIIVFRIWLASSFSHEINADLIHDDFLFVRLAESVAKGEWLGKFDEFTFIKGSGYPILIAIMYLLKIPLIYFQLGLYIIASLLASYFVYLTSRSRKKTFFIVSLLIFLFNPATFDANLNFRVNRPAIYSPMCFLVLDLLLFTIYNRKQISAKQLLAYWLLGFVIFLCWITREESVWLLLPIIITALFIIFDFKSKKLLLFNIAGMLISLYTFTALLFSLARKNNTYYGAPILTEFQHPAFISAYGSLIRVKPEEFIPYVPVSNNTRQKISKESRLFADINQYLDGDVGTGWAIVTQEEAPIEGHKGEIGGGWFIWALRDSVARAGYYTNINQALSFYKQLSKEVNLACEEKRLDCFPRRDTFIFPWNNYYFGNIIQNTKIFVYKLIVFNNVSIFYKNQMEPEENYLMFREMIIDPFTQQGAEIKTKIILLFIFIYKTIYSIIIICGIGLVFIVQIINYKKLLTSGIAYVYIAMSGITSLGTIVVLLASVSYPPALNTGYMGPLYPWASMLGTLSWVVLYNFIYRGKK